MSKLRERNRPRLCLWTKQQEALRAGHVTTREPRGSLRRQSWESDFEELRTDRMPLKTVNRDPSTKRTKKEETKVTRRLHKITAEMQTLIDYALDNCFDDDQVLCNAFNISITRRDIKTLADCNWINDQIINFYLSLIVERSQPDERPKVFAFNTLFYPKLMSSGYAALERWTKAVDLFQNDVILIPVHSGCHWSLATICPQEKTIRYYDSQGRNDQTCLNNLKMYIEAEGKAKNKSVTRVGQWKLECAENIPQQVNFYDCGMFTLRYAEHVSRKCKMSFKQKDMPYYRRRMMYEIMTRTLISP
ncbi:sentrin-specific protease 1-like [Daphnia carinata]|uniref:sentrin-specific protease 1-like n=1 Tax=Daphnia carinata TaxID=120202 RepID=UPI00257CD5D0|nr:sentrin-specific protease 1-like [Daphnia carinata]